MFTGQSAQSTSFLCFPFLWLQGDVAALLLKAKAKVEGDEQVRKLFKPVIASLIITEQRLVLLNTYLSELKRARGIYDAYIPHLIKLQVRAIRGRSCIL